jgi:Ni2+-binding GTPase involved in maturation of urease and hydrogenase
MGAKSFRSDEDVFDFVFHNEPKVVAIVGPKKSGKTFLYETLTKTELSKHYVSTGIYMDSLTYINGQPFHLYDCPSDCIIDADAYIVVLGKDDDTDYIDKMSKTLNSTDIVFVSRFGHNIEDVVDIRYDAYTEVTIVL